MKKALSCLAGFLLLGAWPLRASEDQQRLVGTWSFQSEVDTKADGSPAPAGVAAPECDGLLTYTADGFVSVVIMPKGRTWSTDTATIAELRDTVSNGTAYAGRYELDEANHTVTHIPSVSGEPTYQNQRLVRSYALQDNTLQLSGTFDYRGETIRFAITWMRKTAPQVAAKPEVEVEKIVRERLQAAAKGEKATWRRHISSDCVWTGPGLVIGTTADAENEITANATLPAKALEIRDFETRMFGSDLAIATYVSVERTPDGKGVAKRFRKTDTYRRSAGDWQLISAVEVFAPSRPVAPVESRVLDSYVGEYELDANHVVKVWSEGDKLLSQGTGEPKPTEFLAADRDVFFIDGENGDWIFGRADDNKVDRLIFRLGGSSDVVLRRIK